MQKYNEIKRMWDVIQTQYCDLRKQMELLDKYQEAHDRQQICQQYPYKIGWHVDLHQKSAIQETIRDDHEFFKITTKGLPYLDCYEREGKDYILLKTKEQYDDMNLLIRRINAVEDMSSPEHRAEAIRIVLDDED